MPTPYIQDGLTVDDNERAVIEKYGFELRFVEGSTSEMTLTDPVIRDSGNPDNASFSGGDLEKLMRNAVKERKAFEEANGVAPKSDPARKGKAATKPAATIKAAKLNDEGKKEKRTKKEKTPKERKDNRYLRASRVIVGNVKIDLAALSTMATMSTATANHCTEAWKGVTLALKEKGWLNDAALKVLFPTATPAAVKAEPKAKAKKGETVTA